MNACTYVRRRTKRHFSVQPPTNSSVSFACPGLRDSSAAQVIDACRLHSRTKYPRNLCRHRSSIRRSSFFALSDAVSPPPVPTPSGVSRTVLHPSRPVTYPTPIFSPLPLYCLSVSSSNTRKSRSWRQRCSGFSCAMTGC